MDKVKKLYSKLLDAYNDIQDKFKQYYTVGINSAAKFVWSDKKITEEEGFSDEYMQSKSAYTFGMSHFKLINSEYNKQRRFVKSNISQPFCGRLTERFGTIVEQYRKYEIKKEFNSELNSSREKIHDFTGILEHDYEIFNLLNKGPNFIPTISHNEVESKEAIVNKVINSLQQYSKSITHAKAQQYCNNIALKLNLNHPNLKQSDIDYMVDVLENCNRLEDNALENEPVNNNINQNDIQTIKDLTNKKDIIVNVADKNLGFSINHVTWYTNEYKRQLADNVVYEKKNHNDMDQIIKNGREDLTTIFNKYSNEPSLSHFNLDILNTRGINDIKLPTLNIIPKVHKLTMKANKDNEKDVKGRPIVNGFATINTEPSKLLGTIFHDCLDRLLMVFKDKNIQHPIVNSSDQVIERLKMINLQEYNLDDIYFVSFDFSSLYTSIQKWTVFDTNDFLGSILMLPKSEVLIMKDLFKFIKQYAYFTVGNKLLYLQKEGFAMGSYDSVDGSNLVLLKSEYFMLQNKEISDNMLDFFRYIDDGSMIVVLKDQNIREFITKVASYYPKELKIEFTVSKFLTVFLDLTFGIGHDTYHSGHLHYHVYQKPFNAYAYLDFSSNHPFGVFKGMINTECHRYRTHSCNEVEYTHMCKLFKYRLKKCRYPERFINRHILKYETKMNKKQKCHIKKTTCKILFSKMHNQHLIYKRLLKGKPKNKQSDKILICNQTRPKLKTLLLTKKKLHAKLASYI